MGASEQSDARLDLNDAFFLVNNSEIPIDVDNEFRLRACSKDNEKIPVPHSSRHATC